MGELSFGLLLIFLFSMGTMGLLKIQKKIMPKRYFYYERLIDGLSEDVSYLGVLFRTSVPLFSGFLVGTTALAFHHTENIELFGAAVGFLSAFCLVLPPELECASPGGLPGEPHGRGQHGIGGRGDA